MVTILIVFITGMFAQWQFILAGELLILILIVYRMIKVKAVTKLWLVALALLLGCIRGDGRQSLDTLPMQALNKPLLITGVILNIPQQKKIVTRFYFKTSLGLQPVSQHKILLKWFGCPSQLLATDKWQLKVKLKSIEQLTNPPGFNYKQWLQQQGVVAVGYVIKSTANIKMKSVSGDRLTQWRQELQNIIAHDISNRSLAAIIAALTVGSRALMSTYEWSVFQATGTSHLVAISGLHVGLVAVIGFFLTGWLWRCSKRALYYMPAPKVAAVGALIFALIYAAMAGFSYPTQRALIMIALILWLQLCDRFTPLLRRLLLAFLLIIIMEPVAIYAAGFWLSFAAVAAICYGCSGRLGRGAKYQQHIAMQKSVVLGLSALTLGFFQQVSLIAPLANLVAVPWVSLVIVPTALLACVGLLISPVLGGHLLHMAALLLSPLWDLLKYLAHFHWAVWQRQLGWLTLLYWGLGITVLLLPKGFPGRLLGIFYLLPLLMYII